MAAKEAKRMDDPQQVTSKSTQPEKTQVPPRLSPVDPKWALQSGLLHFVNEATLWPLGFALVVGGDSNGNVGLALLESDHPLVPDIETVEHTQTHAAFLRMLGHRFAPVEETAEERAAKQARLRIVMPR